MLTRIINRTSIFLRSPQLDMAPAVITIEKGVVLIELKLFLASAASHVAQSWHHI